MNDKTIKLMSNIITLSNQITNMDRDLNQTIEKLKSLEQDISDTTIKINEGIKELIMNLNSI